MFDSLFPKEWTTLRRLMWLKTNALARAVYETITGNPVSFTAKAAPLRQLEVAFSPVQAGSGDPSPDNIRPISGWTGVTVHRTGTNLNTIPNPMTQITCYDSGGGEITRWGYEIHLPAGTYTMKPTGFQENGKTYPYQRLCVVDANGFVSYTSFSAAAGASYNQRTITLEDGQWMINYHGSSTGSGYQVRSAHLVIVQGTKDITEDIPYEGDEYTITIGSTVYGGTVDVLTGVLTVGYGAYVLDGVSNKASNLSGPVPSDSPYVNVIGKYNVQLADLANNIPYGATADYRCSHFVWKSYSNRRTVHPDQITWYSSSRAVVWFSDSFTTLDEFNGYLADQYANGTPVTLVYELAEPQTIQLTPQEVSSLLGGNTMWSDANGDLTVTYAVDPATTPIVGKGKVGQAIIGG